MWGKNETGRLLLFPLDSIYGRLIRPSAESAVHHLPCHLSLLILAPARRLFPRLPTRLCLIPSFLPHAGPNISFISLTRAQMLAHVRVHSLEVTDGLIKCF